MRWSGSRPARGPGGRINAPVKCSDDNGQKAPCRAWLGARAGMDVARPGAARGLRPEMGQLRTETSIMSLPHSERVDWVDYGKGFCIVMVVMMHSTLGVEAALGHEGWPHHAVAFARPFRMPDFFLISGLFLARVISRDWRTYLDRKVVHFAYFYVLWVTIQFVVKAPAFAAEHGWLDVGQQYLLSFIEPFGTLWFIYLLPIFFVVTKLTQRIPAAAIWILGAALETARIHTGWTVIDEFAARFVYFYSGYLLASTILTFARDVQ